jgi:hypothetical protein
MELRRSSGLSRPLCHRLDNAIEHAKDAAELAAAWSMLPSVARTLRRGRSTRASWRNSSTSNSLDRRAAVLADQEMQVEGCGAPPCADAILVLGSGGRGESLMGPHGDETASKAE